MPPVAAAIPALTAVGEFLGPVSTILGAVSGAQGLLNKPKKPAPVTEAKPKPYTPAQPAAIARPASLGDFAQFTPQQERSALATRGSQGGLGTEESNYYKNLVQRSLIGEGNKVAPDTSSLLPVESQYFSKQGINTSDIMKFLQQLQG